MVVVVCYHGSFIMPLCSKTIHFFMLMMVKVVVVAVMMVPVVMMVLVVTVLEKTKYPMSSVNGHFQGGAGPESRWK